MLYREGYGLSMGAAGWHPPLLLTPWVPIMMGTMSGGLGGLRWLEDQRSSSCLLGVKYERRWRATLAKTAVAGGCTRYTRMVDRYA